MAGLRALFLRVLGSALVMLALVGCNSEGWSRQGRVWPIPIATGLTNLSYTMLTFDYQWQTRVVGSKQGDATVTLSTQLALKDRKYLLEDPNLYSYRKVFTTHGAEPNDAEVKNWVVRFFDADNTKGAYAAFHKLGGP